MDICFSRMWTGLLLWGAICAAEASGGPAPVLPNPKLLNAELLTRGAVVYRNHCAGCHGGKGDGNGPAAYGLQPRPRDFTTGLFKFRSTPQGALPTDEDLVRTIQQGLPGTSMPGFDLMPPRDVLAVAQYLKVFSERWRDSSHHAAPIPIPAPPDWLAREDELGPHLIRAREFYTASCAPCHGARADGRGPAAAMMLDNWGQPITPADLRRPSIRSGRNLTDIYKVLVTGINGTPMPSFQGLISEEQKWELVAFVDHLRRERNGSSLLASEPALSEPAAIADSDSSDYE